MKASKEATNNTSDPAAGATEHEALNVAPAHQLLNPGWASRNRSCTHQNWEEAAANSSTK